MIANVRRRSVSSGRVGAVTRPLPRLLHESVPDIGRSARPRSCRRQEIEDQQDLNPGAPYAGLATANSGVYRNSLQKEGSRSCLACPCAAVLGRSTGEFSTASTHLAQLLRFFSAFAEFGCTGGKICCSYVSYLTLSGNSSRALFNGERTAQ